MDRLLRYFSIPSFDFLLPDRRSFILQVADRRMPPSSVVIKYPRWTKIISTRSTVSRMGAFKRKNGLLKIILGEGNPNRKLSSLPGWWLRQWVCSPPPPILTKNNYAKSERSCLLYFSIYLFNFLEFVIFLFICFVPFVHFI